jgi:hypothetical protein
MKKFYLILLLITSHLYAKEHIILPLSKTLPELKTIDKYAIVIPGGKNTIYVFVDPFCHYSQAFIKKAISPDNHLKKTYTYKVFLLKLNKFDSASTIKNILSSKNKLKSLTNFMVKHKKIETDEVKETSEVNKIIEKVSVIGNNLDIYKRPYMIIEYEGWEEDEDDFDDFDDDEEE